MFRGCFCAQYISIRHPNRRPSKQKHRMNATAKENKQRFAYLFRSKPNSKLTRRPPLICNTNEAKRSIHLAREVSLSICIVSEAQQNETQITCSHMLWYVVRALYSCQSMAWNVLWLQVASHTWMTQSKYDTLTCYMIARKSKRTQRLLCEETPRRI